MAMMVRSVPSGARLDFELDLPAGVEVEIKHKTPGGPFVLGVKGCQLVLGRGMAQKILVS